MIKKHEIDGRSATVIYLTRDLQPADQGEHELVKIVFDDDGETRWAVPNNKENDEDEDEDT